MKLNSAKHEIISFSTTLGVNGFFYLPHALGWKRNNYTADHPPQPPQIRSDIRNTERGVSEEIITGIWNPCGQKQYFLSLLFSLILLRIDC